MKIGLISYHAEPNYGTMLQAYALEKAIKREGVDCEYINYKTYEKPSVFKIAIKSFLKLFGINLNRRGDFAFFETRSFRYIVNAFKAFHSRYISVSEHTYYPSTIQKANKFYDFFIVGSDQTWSPYMTAKNNCINFLPFVDDDIKKRAYAPSIGTTHIDKEYFLRLINELKSFEYLSCRERSNCEQIESQIGKPVQYVLDPTLLLSFDEWNEIAISPTMPPKSYILAYILGEKKNISEYAENLGLKKGLPVYYIVTRPCYFAKEHYLDGIGPEHFLGLIKNAAYVVTDSFHGSIFSINYGVNFYSFTKRKTELNNISNDNDRIIEILKEFNLENRFKCDNDDTYEDDIIFDNIKVKLAEYRKESIQYLKRIIK